MLSSYFIEGIKVMKGKILNKKIVFILFAFLFVLFVFSSCSLGVSIKFKDDTVNISYVEEKGDGLILYNKKTDSYYYLCFWHEDHGIHSGNIKYFAKIRDNIVAIGGKCHDEYIFTNYALYNYDEINGTLGSLVSSMNRPIMYVEFYVSDYECAYSSADLYSNENYDELHSSDFFRLAPLERILLAEVQEKVTFQEIMGVLPLILVVVVSFLGLRKALRWLSTLLRHF